MNPLTSGPTIPDQIGIGKPSLANSSTVEERKLDRVSAIDGLRGVAALAVLLYHARGVFFIGLTETYRLYGLHPNLDAYCEYLTAPIGLGFLGVTLFFVLSGYCIHRRGARLLVNQQTVDFRTFAFRRFIRIYPTYVVALLVTGVVDWYFFKRFGSAPTGQNNSWYALLVSLLSLQGYLAPYFGSNGVFWTLAMEIHLYLVYPILFFCSMKYGPRNTLMLTLIVGLAYVGGNWLFHFDQYFPYRSERGPVFLPYWFTWTIGFYLAEIEANRAQLPSKTLRLVFMSGGGLLGLTLLAVGSPLLADMSFALFFGGCLYASMTIRGRHLWNGFFGKMISVVGVFSYSLYAVHAPLLYVFKYLISPDGRRFLSPLPTFGGAAFAIALSWIFFLLIERWTIAKPRIVAASSTLIDPLQ